MANDVSINEAATAKCRVNGDAEGEGETAAAATPCWGGIREAARLARLVEGSFRNINSARTRAQPRLLAKLRIRFANRDRPAARERNASSPFNGEPSAQFRGRECFSRRALLRAGSRFNRMSRSLIPDWPEARDLPAPSNVITVRKVARANHNSREASKLEI